MRRNGLAGLGTGLALAMLLAACGSASGGTTAAPSAAPTPEPTAPLGMFTGHDVCSAPEDDNPTDDVAPVVCERVTTDPRLTGTLTSPDGEAAGNPDLFIEWRTFTMTNDGGSWTCPQLVIGRADFTGWADQICTGTNGYAGLTAYIHAISGNNASDFGILGWVEEAP
jgi:hypothetical protein